MITENITQNFSSLKKKQKEAVGLLSIGTFLEYFDLMIYVHMAVLINDLFFPKTDPFVASLLSAVAFCSTYMLRPIGALIFGYIADHIGRKVVIIITTFLMAICCAVMASLPTYKSIGISASIAMIACRMVQGMSASAESRGAEIYLTESSKPPVQYPLVALITVFSGLGTTAALGVASLLTNTTVISSEYSWRVAFIVGAIVALIGTVARTSLKEADDFVNKKKLLKNRLESNNQEWDEIHNNITSKISAKSTSIAYFLIKCARPPCFYFIYIYCSDVLKHQFGFTPAEIISQNFLVSIVDLGGLIALTYISYRIHPLKILKIRLFLFITLIALFPMVISTTQNPSFVFLFQCLGALSVFDEVPASPIFYKYFPIFKRFTYTSLLSAVAKLATYAISSFGLAYFTHKFGYSGMFVIFIPVGISFFIGVSYFQRLESNQM